MKKQYIEEFIGEANDYLGKLDLDLNLLEGNLNDLEIVRRLLRCMHTLNGVSGFLQLTTLGKVTNAGEYLLIGIRQGELVMTAEIVSVLRELGESLHALLGEIQDGHYKSRQDYSGLIARLKSLRAPEAAKRAGRRRPPKSRGRRPAGGGPSQRHTSA